jgi:hypothetical protein
MDNESKETHGVVFHGAGLCNRPVVKGMKPVAALSQIQKFVDQGLSEKEAIRKALSEITDGEKKGTGMKDEKEMGEMEKKLGEYEKKLADMGKLFEMLGVANIEEAMKKISDMMAAETAMKNSTDTAQSKLAMAEKTVRELRSTIDTMKKTETFNVMLAEGKVVEAQRDAYLKGNMQEFIEKASAVKLTEMGHSGEKAGGKKLSDDEIIKKANELLAAKKASDIRAAMKMARNQE